jgi:hypothetical protein
VTFEKARASLPQAGHELVGWYLAEWLPQKRHVKKKKGPFCHQWGGHPRMHHWHSLAHPWNGNELLGHSRTAGNLPWRRWGLQVCTLMSDSTSCLGQKNRDT